MKREPVVEALFFQFFEIFDGLDCSLWVKFDEYGVEFGGSSYIGTLWSCVIHLLRDL
jgi:hypothetical protein